MEVYQCTIGWFSKGHSGQLVFVWGWPLIQIEILPYCMMCRENCI